MDEGQQALLLVCLGATLLCVQLYRVTSRNPRFALKDTRGDLLIPRSALQFFAWFPILFALSLLRHGISNYEPSTARALVSFGFGIVGIILVISVGRLLRRLAWTDEGLRDGWRGLFNVPRADIRSVEVRRLLGLFPILLVNRYSGRTRWLWAFDLAVTPESVAAAINSRLPTSRRFVF